MRAVKGIGDFRLLSEGRGDGFLFLLMGKKIKKLFSYIWEEEGAEVVFSVRFCWRPWENFPEKICFDFEGASSEDVDVAAAAKF